MLNLTPEQINHLAQVGVSDPSSIIAWEFTDDREGSCLAIDLFLVTSPKTFQKREVLATCWRPFEGSQAHYFDAERIQRQAHDALTAYVPDVRPTL